MCHFEEKSMREISVHDHQVWIEVEDDHNM